eukprot:Platyproteum_vivax@DN9677_c0_g1_i1.p1
MQLLILLKYYGPVTHVTGLHQKSQHPYNRIQRTTKFLRQERIRVGRMVDKLDQTMWNSGNVNEKLEKGFNEKENYEQHIKSIQEDKRLLYTNGDRFNRGYHGWVEPRARIVFNDFQGVCERIVFQYP